MLRSRLATRAFREKKETPSRYRIDEATAQKGGNHGKSSPSILQLGLGLLLNISATLLHLEFACVMECALDGGANARRVLCADIF